MFLHPAPSNHSSNPLHPRRSARHRLRKKLIQLITQGRFEPGEKLRQTHLARQFQVSVTVMREALLDVRSHGLLKTRDNRGFYVRHLKPAALLDLYDLRELLEGLAARKACARMTPAIVAELRAMIDEMCELETRGEFERRAELDRRFHNRINQVSGSYSVATLTRQCSLFGKMIYMKTNPARIRRMHEPLLDAIARNQPERAERLARAHVRNGRRQAEELLRSGGGISWLPSAVGAKLEGGNATASSRIP